MNGVHTFIKGGKDAAHAFGSRQRLLGVEGVGSRHCVRGQEFPQKPADVLPAA